MPVDPALAAATDAVQVSDSPHSVVPFTDAKGGLRLVKDERTDRFGPKDIVHNANSVS